MIVVATTTMRSALLVLLVSTGGAVVAVGAAAVNALTQNVTILRIVTRRRRVTLVRSSRSWAHLTVVLANFGGILAIASGKVSGRSTR